jgi:membrane associated rhomboid family serine protease
MTSQTKSATQIVRKKFIFSLLPFFVLGGLMFSIKLIEQITDSSLSPWGLKPRIPMRLAGIISYPFLHADWFHLFSNLVPFSILTVLIYNLFPRFFGKIMVFTFFLSGFWTWCFARPGTIIGASGWVYALLGFLLAAGFSKVNRQTMVIAGGLAFLYGGMVYGLVPSQPRISWEAHLMGLLAGISGAFYWHKDLAAEKTILDVPKINKVKNDTEPPYPYWLYNSAHVLDASGQVIHPDDLIWENGKPFLKPKEETKEQEAETIKAKEQIPAPQNNTGRPNSGYWYVTVS